MTTEQPYQIDPRLACPFCIKADVKWKRPLRVPLVFNATEPVSGQYWCTECHRAGTETRVAWAHSHVKGATLLALTMTARRERDQIEDARKNDPRPYADQYRTVERVAYICDNGRFTDND